ncbi:reverse transcriptase family protein, partial [Pseudomonas aeruginosa]
CPLHKKGDVLDCQNYRGISLLNTAYKIFANVLFGKLKPFVEPRLGEYQCGFRPGRSTIDQIFSLRQILEKTLEFNADTYHLFIDFKAAYDNISRDFLYQAMHEIGVPPKL